MDYKKNSFLAGKCKLQGHKEKGKFTDDPSPIVTNFRYGLVLLSLNFHTFIN
jgi:hypothetical protein